MIGKNLSFIDMRGQRYSRSDLKCVNRYPRMNTSVRHTELDGLQAIERGPALPDHTDLIHLPESLTFIGGDVASLRQTGN